MAAEHRLRNHAEEEHTPPDPWPPDDGEPYFDIVCMLNGDKHEFSGDEVSLLFPAVCLDSDDTAWMAWVRCGQ